METARNMPVKFDRTDTKAVKGIAVILMLFHHLAAYPDRAPVGFAGFGAEFAEGGTFQALAMAANLCVSIFFFLGGYGLFLRWKGSQFSIKQSVLDLYKAYWKVFIVFVPIAVLFFARSGDGINALCTRYTFARSRDLITAVLSDFTGWTCNLNPEWWFFRSYVCAIPLGCLFCMATGKHRNFWVDLFLVFGLDILIRSVFPGIAGTEAFSALDHNLYFSAFLNISSGTSAFFAGIVFAKYDGLCAIKKMLLELPCSTAVSCLGLAGLFWCRAFAISGKADIIYCALMIPMLSVIFDRIRMLKKGFAFLGRHSTNMWLIHSFYCYYFLEATQLVYGTGNALLSLVILIVLSLASSILLNGFYAGVGKLVAQKSR